MTKNHPTVSCPWGISSTERQSTSSSWCTAFLGPAPRQTESGQTREEFLPCSILSCRYPEPAPAWRMLNVVH